MVVRRPSDVEKASWVGDTMNRWVDVGVGVGVGGSVTETESGA